MYCRDDGVLFRVKRLDVFGRKASLRSWLTRMATPPPNLGFEDQLWKAADALRSNMDAAEYKHVVLGLIFLKYISDTFEEQHTRLEAVNASGRRPGRPGRIPGRQYFLGAQRGPLGVPAGKREAAHHRQDGGRRHAGRGPRQPLAQRRAAKGLRPPGSTNSASANCIDMIADVGLAARQPLQGHPRSRLRVLPLPSLPAPRARRAASSTRRGPSCSSWSRC